MPLGAAGRASLGADRAPAGLGDLDRDDARGHGDDRVAHDHHGGSEQAAGHGLRRDVAGNFTLYGTAVRSSEGLTTETKVETENDRDESKVTTTTRTEAEDGRIGTAGAVATFLLRPRANIALAEHVGTQVQLSAIVVDADVVLRKP